MSKIFKRVTVFLLLLVLCSNVTLSNAAFANKHETIIDGHKSNFVILNNDLQNFEYTYDENGKSFKVFEITDATLKHVDSKIFQKNENGNYELFLTLVTEIEDGIATLTTTDQDGTVSTESTDLNPFIESIEKGSDIVLDFNDSPKLNTPLFSTASTSLTNWKYSAELKGSNAFVKYTVLGIVATIGVLVAGALGGALAPAVTAGLTSIASAIIADNLDIVYYKQYVYYKYIIDTNLPRAEWTSTQFYESSQRTQAQKIGDTISHEYYVPGWS